jgi:hypothetical protein
LKKQKQEDQDFIDFKKQKQEDQVCQKGCVSCSG